MAPRQTLAHRLRDVPLFRRLSMEQCRLLTVPDAFVEYRPREKLYGQGEPATTCFVLLSGTVQLSLRLNGRDTTAGMLVGDGVFGLEALEGGRTRPDTATAAIASELLQIKAKNLKSLLLNNPRFQFDLLNALISQLRDKTTHAVRTGHYDAEQRIAAYFIESSLDQSADSPGVVRTSSQAELADYLALTPETFCRKVKKFRQLGWIGGRGNEYVIKQVDSLKRLVDG